MMLFIGAHSPKKGRSAWARVGLPRLLLLDGEGDQACRPAHAECLTNAQLNPRFDKPIGDQTATVDAQGMRPTQARPERRASSEGRGRSLSRRSPSDWSHHRRLPDTVLHHRRPDQALEHRRGLPHAMAQGEHLLGSLSASLAHLLETRRLTQKVNRRGRHPLPIAWIRACDIRPSARADQNAIVPLSISSATPPTPMAIIGQPQAIPSKTTSGMASLREV